ncbi:MAG: hydrogenase [Deltaproteobacteria bacterium]|nr:hydrogenase [Deltaproteobacteria bacterium]
MTFFLLKLALILVAGSGVPGLFLPRTSVWGERSAVFLLGLGALSGLIGSGRVFFLSAFSTAHAFPWPPAGGSYLGLDALSAFFLVPIFVMGFLGAVFGLGYWPQQKNQHNASGLRCFWGTLLAGMALLVVSTHALAFLLGWEVMALSAFFLVTTEDELEECRKSGLVYLLATHFGTLVLFGLFVFWRHLTGSFAFSSPALGSVSRLQSHILFFLAFVGFGLKAGIMPLHFWLPGAHANAPSHVSAVLSGVMLKIGLYGLIRILSLLPDPPALWGWFILAAGALSGLLGVIFALAQHDLKRLLAYHSVENIGIILLGLGLAMLGRSYGRPEWIMLGMAGCLLHIWNHSLFKSLLFLGAGAIVHATHTRRIDQLGGLAQRLPWTAVLFLIGAVAICGLPPLNGFVSEFFVYLGVFKTFMVPGNSGLMVGVAAPVLAMIGALAIACFVKVYGAIFLGTPRSPAAASALEAPGVMLAPMLVLAGLCLVLGLAPGLVVPVLEQAIAAWLPVSLSTDSPILAGLIPFSAISWSAFLLLSLVLLPVLCVRRGRKPWSRRKVVTWDCGYAAPTAGMQYTASSFARTLLGLFAWVLKPEVRGPEIRGIMPEKSRLHSHVAELVLDRALIPGFRRLKRQLRWFYRFQQGQTRLYVLYIVVAVLLMLTTLLPFAEIFAGLL